MAKKDEAPKVQILTKAEADKLILDANTLISDSSVDDLEISDQEEYEFFASELAEVKGHIKRLEEQKKSATDPLTQVINTIRSWFKPTLDKLEAREITLKKKMGAYILLQENARRRALAEVSSAVTSGANSKTVSKGLRKLEEAKVEVVPGTSMRFTYDVEIIDQELLPDEWWTPDEGALTRFVRATNGEKEVPGCVIHKRPIISQKAK